MTLALKIAAGMVAATVIAAAAAVAGLALLATTVERKIDAAAGEWDY